MKFLFIKDKNILRQTKNSYIYHSNFCFIFLFEKHTCPYIHLRYMIHPKCMMLQYFVKVEKCLYCPINKKLKNTFHDKIAYAVINLNNNTLLNTLKPNRPNSLYIFFL